jgi:SAM-dependent methyltransferase
VNKKLNPKEFFQEQADAYDRVHYADGARSFMTVRLSRVLNLIDDMNLAAGSSILDAGCGPGHLALTLAQKEYDVSAVDTSEAMLTELSRNADIYKPLSEVHTQLASIEELPFEDNRFDLICSLGVIEYLDTDEKVLQEFLRSLKPGGRMILSVTNYWSPAGYLDFFVEAAKRQKWILAAVNFFWTRMGHDEIRPRFFKIRRHRPEQLRKTLVKNGFELDRTSYFYMLPWPHPFDRMFPKLTDKLGSFLEPLSKTLLGILAEGYIVSGRKPD